MEEFDMKIQRNKVVIIGAGNVGSAVLYSLLSSKSLAEIVIIDVNEDKAVGEALDASHATSFAYSPNIQVRSGDYSDCRDANIIVMTAGPSAKPGEVLDRVALTKTNLKVVKDVMTKISAQTKEALIIMVSNPVDVLTYYAQNYFDYPKDKIFGTGTLLDTARFRRILSAKYMVDSKNVHGYILGEHGESAFATWSCTNVAGIPIDDMNIVEEVELNRAQILEEVIHVGSEVLVKKGFTNFGIAKSVERIIQAILSNELSVLPLSTTLEGEYGIENVALSLPCIVTKDGIGKRLEIPLSVEEANLLKASADKMKKVFETTYEQ